MASTYSDLKIELIATGEQTGTWGSTTNTNLGTAIEEAITGSATVTFSSSDVTLTLTDTNTTQAARNLRLVCSGTSGGARNLILGSGCQIEKLYLIQNDLADTVTVKNTTGTGVAVAAGARTFVFNDGTNVTEATNVGGLSGIVPIANGGTGASTATNARTNLGLGTLATLSSINNANWSGTDLAVTNGGTGASDAATARTNLGLGTIATQASNNVSITGGSITGITDLAVTDGGTGSSTASGARTNLGLGTLSTLNTINNGNWSGTDLAVVNGGTGASDAGTARTNLGLGTMAIQNSSSVSISGGTVDGLSSLTCYGSGGEITNTALGRFALYVNTSLGVQNTAIGASALSSNTTGDNNTAVGYQTLSTAVSTSYNTAVGYRALYSGLTPSYNTAVGYQALRSNSSTNNTAVGTDALYSSTDAFGNTALGSNAAYDITTGDYNTAIGLSALRYAETSSFMTCLGYATGFQSTGTYCTYVGSGAGSNANSGTNNTCIGYNAQNSSSTVSNEFTLGNTSVSNLRCNDQTISALSDARDKTDIVDSPYGLSFVNTLQPRQFKWQTRDGNIKDGSTRLGFIAQELLEATAGKNDVLDLVYESNPEKLEAKQGNLIPILVQAIKELSEKCDNLQAEVNKLKGE